MKIVFIISTLWFLTNNSTFGHVSGSLNTNVQAEQTQNEWAAENEETDDFTPGLLLFVLFAFVFIFLCVGAGIALAVAGLILLFGMIGTGVVSTSVLVGLNYKSFKKGFKVFFISTSLLGGLFVGVISFWLLNMATHWWTLKTALLTGSLTGLFTGLIFGLFALYVIQKVTTYLKMKLQGNTYSRKDDNRL